ncbi:MAG: ATP-dependent protease [Candidatus Pelagibacterales bacterium]|nr:MAG: ATP-dependent protease [Pelagibacterales bacterium]
MKQQKNLPNILPIFPLSNFIFFPKTSVPLNIFEPRYLEMINDSLKKDKLIGIIQPKNKKNVKNEKKPELYSIGCVGKIISFDETEDNRILLVLNGISRFEITEEITNDKLYRQCKVDFSKFEHDVIEGKNESRVSDLNLIFNDLKDFFQKKGYELDWNELKKQNLDQAINSLCMIAPFSLEEKQILLESNEINDRKNKLKEILNIYSVSNVETNYSIN